MILNQDGSQPIYIQIAEWIENEIIDSNFDSDDKVYSQYQLAEMFNINPATAAKGLNILVDEQILYKRRGLGMFVANGAREKILSRRRNETLKGLIDQLVVEAGRLQVSEQELITMVKAARREGEEQ